MASKNRITKEELKAEYESILHKLNDFCSELSRQIGILINKEQISLGFPLQHRVKTWNSVANKVDRGNVHIKKLTDFQDLVGIRLILLFKRDINTITELLNTNLQVIRHYDTQSRLKDDQFGYSSLHYIVEISKEWLAVPSLSSFKGLRAEIQVRTVAQHTWATASHFFQYKQESNVPQPILRSIYRVSALLETVDLEFERVLREREHYKEQIETVIDEQTLNTDLLESMLDSLLPPKNKDKTDEYYAALLEELHAFDVNTTTNLRDFIQSNIKKALSEDAGRAEEIINGEGDSDDDFERAERGVYYTHVGLVRIMLGLEFGDKWDNYRRNKDA